MSKLPIILISPSVEKKADEFGDLSVSLSETYQRALVNAEGLPLALPALPTRELITEAVRHSDGVLLTGGDDVDPRLYGKEPPLRLRAKVKVTPDAGARDWRELVLLDEVFRQRKPLLAICRGHQMLNVALGGTLWVDIASQRPGTSNHQRTDRRSEIVHEVLLTQGSLLAKIIAGHRLSVNSTHHQAVARVARPLKVAAVSSDGIVEGLELKPAEAGMLPFLVSVQFHPERLVDRYAEHQAIFNAFTRACVRNGKHV